MLSIVRPRLERESENLIEELLTVIEVGRSSVREFLGEEIRISDKSYTTVY